MSSRPSTFKEVDIKRSVRAAENAGISVGRIDVDRNGTISIYPASPGSNKVAPKKSAPAVPSDLQPWD